MKNIALVLLLLTNSFAFETKIYQAFAIGVFHKNGKGENIQHKKITEEDYNGEVYSKIAVIGKLNSTIPKVKIGNSIGTLIDRKPIFKDNRLLGEELSFKQYTVKKGYFTVRIKNRLYDTKVFVK